LAELAGPWFVFWPRLARHIAGSVIVLFQINIILSGNLSFLNWLTIVPALACFDDGFWSKLLPRRLVHKAQAVAASAEPSRSMLTTAWAISFVIAFLSIQPVVNMVSPKQIMNTSFDPLDIVNTYGAFGTVGQERLNVIFEGTSDDDFTDKANWKPYIYKGLPVLPDRRPPQIAPYQLRLDWQMWFASMASANEYPWTVNLVWKLLHNNPDAVSLFAGNPFAGNPPRYIRAELYRYKFVKSDTAWWAREKLGDWIPPMSASDQRLIQFLKSYGWVK
jgi:hypothetical protein